MSVQQRIRSHFEDSIAAKRQAFDVMVPEIERAIALLAHCLKAGGKILLAGNGGSAADCQHFAAELIGRFERERRELAAIALTTDSSILTAVANDYAYDQVFAKQVRGLGQPGDVFVAISTSGNSSSITLAAQAAQAKGLAVLAFTGKGGGKLGALLRATDVHLCVPQDRTARIQEVHGLIVHCLCDGIDEALTS
jgi:D-sedoheptulose 7-phosphate isomerase